MDFNSIPDNLPPDIKKALDKVVAEAKIKGEQSFCILELVNPKKLSGLSREVAKSLFTLGFEFGAMSILTYMLTCTEPIMELLNRMKKADHKKVVNAIGEEFLKNMEKHKSA